MEVEDIDEVGRIENIEGSVEAERSDEKRNSAVELARPANSGEIDRLVEEPGLPAMTDDSGTAVAHVEIAGNWPAFVASHISSALASYSE